MNRRRRCIAPLPIASWICACDEGLALAGRLHVLPDFHGNRSPLGDPFALGVISGLTLDSDFDSLCRLYWRTCVSIALGVRHILETLNTRGYAIDTLHVTGGHTKNALLMELYADATGCTVVELVGQGRDACWAWPWSRPPPPVSTPALMPHASPCSKAAVNARPIQPRAPQFDKDYRIFPRDAAAAPGHRRDGVSGQPPVAPLEPLFRRTIAPSPRANPAKLLTGKSIFVA